MMTPSEDEGCETADEAVAEAAPSTSDFFAIYSPDARRRDVAQLAEAVTSAPAADNPLATTLGGPPLTAYGAWPTTADGRPWTPPTQTYVDYCKEMANELPRCFELTHAEMANVELHLAPGGNRVKAFEIIQEAGKRWQREGEERKQFFQESVDQLNRALTAAEHAVSVPGH